MKWAAANLASLPQGDNTFVACAGVRCTLVAAGVFSTTSLFSNDYGATWSSSSLGQVASDATISWLNCDSSGLCAAVGKGRSGGVTFYSDNGGDSWAGGE